MSAPQPVHGWIDEHINDGPPTSGRRRVLPHDLIAEAGVLGGIILYCDRLRGQGPRNAILKALPELEVDDFYDHGRRGEPTHLYMEAVQAVDDRARVEEDKEFHELALEQIRRVRDYDAANRSGVPRSAHQPQPDDVHAFMEQRERALLTPSAG